MAQSVKLVGIDCGSTTSSAVVATAEITTGPQGRVEIGPLDEVFRSEMVLTPFRGDTIDLAGLGAYLDGWLAAAATDARDVFGGGALITGLAAERTNAAAITQWIESRLGDSIVATADSPALESWLAFMGNCHELSKAIADTSILNIDIGGGTTNLALGRAGQVLATGALWVGARHFQFSPGSYQLIGFSRYGAAVLEHLQIVRREGDVLDSQQIQTIVNFYVRLIEAAVEADESVFAAAIGSLHRQVSFHKAALPSGPPAITFSGGVGQLVYDVVSGTAQPITQFGDLGGELARGLAESPLVTGQQNLLAPQSLGRATVYGLLRHSTELAGATLYLPHPEQLPLKNLPIVGTLDAHTGQASARQIVELAARTACGACIQIALDQHDLASLRTMARQLAELLKALEYPRDRPLVLLVSTNLGKALGNYITDWGTRDLNLIVLDEVPNRDAQFVRVGRPRDGIVPLWLYAVR